MADDTKPVRRGRGRAQKQISDRTNDVEEQVSDTTDEAEDQAEQAKDVGKRAGGGGTDAARTVTSELKDTIRETALEILRPVARQATKSAAQYAVKRGPGLIMDKVLPKVEEAGGAGALAKDTLAKGSALAKGGEDGGGLLQRLRGRGDDAGEESGSTVPMQAHVDVASDLQTVYDQFTQFEDFSEFAEHVERIEQRDDTRLRVEESVRRGQHTWDVEITEQEPCERIVFEGPDGNGAVGVVTFHRLSERLTRVDVSVLLQPSGILEKTVGLRAYRNALESDLTRFKAWIELRDEATGAWRGRIEEGEVADSEDGGDDAGDEERSEPRGEEEDAEQPRDEQDEEEYEDEEEEPEDEEEEAKPRSRGRGRFARDSEEDEDDEPEEEEEPEPPARRAPRRRRAAASSSSGSSTKPKPKPRSRARKA